MSNMIEHVARALARHDDPKHENWWPSYEMRARAAIEAMGVPTGDVMDAPRHLFQWLAFPRPTERELLRHCERRRIAPPPECRDVDHVPPKRMMAYWVLTAMIDAALSERQP